MSFLNIVVTKYFLLFEKYFLHVVSSQKSEKSVPRHTYFHNHAPTTFLAITRNRNSRHRQPGSKDAMPRHLHDIAHNVNPAIT